MLPLVDFPARRGEGQRIIEIVERSKGHMVAYKRLCSVGFVDTLPKSGSGKILWRVLQEREQEKIAEAK